MSANLSAGVSEISKPIQISVDSMPHPLVILRANNGQVLYANFLACTLLNKDIDKIIGERILGLYDDDLQRSNEIKLLKNQTYTQPKYLSILDSHNRKIIISTTCTLMRFRNELAISIALQIVPPEVVKLEKLHTVLKNYDIALQAAHVGIWSWSLNTNKIAFDQTVHELFGIKPGSFNGVQNEFLNFIVPEDREEQLKVIQKYQKEGGKFDTKFRIIRPDGETRVIINRGEATKNNLGRVIKVLGICWDVTENFALNAKLQHQSIHDPLTGLINRNEMQRRLQEILDTYAIQFTENTFCYFDIDRFKVINDTCGHEAGDALLSKIAAHLQPYIKKSDLFARMGGNEFALLIVNCSSNEARKAAERLHQAVKDLHFEWNNKVFDINISMALVPINADQSITDVLGSADVALAAAKDSGRNRIHEYKPHDSTMIRRHGEMAWVLELEAALREDRFQLYFQTIQPISAVQDDGVHYEVLLRIVKDSGEILPPAELLKAAEQYDMASRVDKWVINSIFDWLKNHKTHCEQLSLCSINLSGSSIGDQAFLNFLHEKLEDNELPIDKISFEITENAAIKNIKKSGDFIKTLKEYGCKFALDDFGSGLSSFAYLKDLPVDILKIDGIFVREINSEPVNYAMVKAIHDVGKFMNMKTIAEYVENEEIFKTLKEIGVDYGQGYYFGKSTRLDEIIIVDSKIADSA